MTVYDYASFEQNCDNLNDLIIDNADGPCQPMDDHAATSADGKTGVLFKNLEQELVLRIRAADVVLGCVAWLTHFDILAALARKRGVSIIVQKEDFLRPDYGAGGWAWRNKLRAAYERIPGLERFNIGGLVSSLSYASDPTMDPVRCVGNYNEDKQSAFPRMHHKFLLFCREVPPSNPYADEDDSVNYEQWKREVYGYLEPFALWTGSFNLTLNATRSFENAIVSADPKLTQAFFDEYCQIAALSEPLDWTHNWVAPEYRIGT